MIVFLLVVILLAVLGVLGLALKIAAALVLGFMIATAAIVLIGYYIVRHELRKMQRSVAAPQTRATGTISATTVEVGEPQRSNDAGVDDRY
jgi:hypothetical protein